MNAESIVVWYLSGVFLFLGISSAKHVLELIRRTESEYKHRRIIDQLQTPHKYK